MADNAIAVPGNLTRKILKNQGIMLPLSYLQTGTFAEMEDKLRSGIWAAQIYITEIRNNPDKIIDKGAIGSTLQMLNYANTELTKKYGINLTNDDIKIIAFLSQNKLNLKSFLELLGPYTMLSEVSRELDGEYSKIVKVTLLLYLFQNSYELLLEIVDRNLYGYLNSQQGLVHKGGIKEFLKVDRMRGDHAVAGSINEALFELGVVTKSNSSIFHFWSKDFRNSLAHFTILYDSKRDKIIMPGGNEITSDELGKFYCYVYAFMYEWVKNSMANKQLTQNNFQDKLEEAFRTDFTNLSKEMTRAVRAGAAKHWGSVIIYFDEKKD